MKIIINADDYGVDLDRDIGIFFCSLLRTISSTSVVVTNKLNFLQKLMIKVMNKRISIGIHINLTDNPLITCKTEDLCKKKYDIRSKYSFWTNCLKDDINIDLIYNEIDNQIETFVKYFGFFPNYIDCHNHCNIFNQKIQKKCQSIANDNNIVLRVPYEKYLADDIKNIFKDNNLIKPPKNLNEIIDNYELYYKYDMVMYNYLCIINCKEERKLKFTGSIYGYYRNANMFEHLINGFSYSDTIQFMTHPGFYIRFLKHRTKFSNCDRVKEFSQLIKIKNICKKRNIEIISYRDI